MDCKHPPHTHYHCHEHALQPLASRAGPTQSPTRGPPLTGGSFAGVGQEGAVRLLSVLESVRAVPLAGPWKVGRCVCSGKVSVKASLVRTCCMYPALRLAKPHVAALSFCVWEEEGGKYGVALLRQDWLARTHSGLHCTTTQYTHKYVRFRAARH